VKNPWLSYTLIRLGMFFGLFLLMLFIGFDPFFSAIISAAVSFAIALVFLDKQRKAMSETVAQRLARNEKGTYLDESGMEEDAILDSKAKADNGDAGADQDGKA
jgi:hypothetical protein